MKSVRGFTLFLAASIALLPALAAHGQSGEGAGKPAGQEEKADVSKEKVRIPSLTIFPVTMAGSQYKNVGQALGLILEKNGFRKIEIAEIAFKPPKDAPFEKIAAAFGAHVAADPVETDFALYCEYLGRPGEGVDEVRAVITDRAGKVAWKERQTPEDAEFQNIRPTNPMSCCVLMSQLLRPMLVLAPPAERSEDGPMARLWAKMSGLPERKEFEAIEARCELFRKTASGATVAVFPIRVHKRTDKEGAVHLAGLLNENKLCKAEVVEESLWFEIKPNSNEQRILWDMAKEFKAHMQKKAPDADYALYGDYMISPRNDKVMAVHFVICDRKGDWVIVDFQNDHHRDFNAVDPKNLKDCNRLALRRLEGYLK